ncbi:HD domain-containing phosphohydrolase [Wukongibacter baidiensis]|uniref:HD-GYP domain-containing protein n=1 Tax=Wukongibacter baidiensis TaxID=1723361 RepID=UPI003D7FC2B7
MESNNILLLSNDLSIYNSIKKSLDKLDVSIHRISPQNLMLTIYKLDGKILIVDLDDYRESVTEIISSIQAYDFLPVIYIFSSPDATEFEEALDSEVVIHKSILHYALPNIVKQSLTFKQKLDHTTESYHAMDSIYGITDNLLSKYISSKGLIYDDFIKKLLTNVFTSNPFISNSPSIVLLTSMEHDKSKTEIYRLSEGLIIKDDEPIVLNNAGSPYYNITLENEFFFNCHLGELSDIEDYRMLFNKEILATLPQLNNICGYVTTNIAMIGLNYQSPLSSFEADIIKGLCVECNLFENIHTRINEVNDAFVYTTNALARAAEANDDDTGNHIKRVNEYSRLIAESLGMDDDFISTIHFSAQMHDVGKIHIPRNIICKAGKLTDEEFHMIKRHPIHGAKIIGDSPHLKMAKEIALYHHERYDGTGYPRGVKGEEIPMSARIVALADIYDALRSKRAYKPEFSHDKTYDIIINGDGRVMPGHFDSNVLKAFLEIHNKMDDIYNTYK